LTASAFSFRQKCCKEDPQKATVASVLGPAPYKVKMGRKYYWCSCGLSKNQPFCDGGHKGSGFSPTPYTAEKTGTFYFCGCKHGKNGPLCDGSHKQL
jgi:CDGSH-type Zn-finger protein